MAQIREELILIDRFTAAFTSYLRNTGRAADASDYARRMANRYSDALRDQGAAADTIVGKLKNLAGAYIGIQGASALVNLSDTMTQTTARLNMMTGSLEKTEELNQMIYESAQRSRGSYQATADMVAKLGTLAGDAFNSSKELVDFAEQLNKQITLSGASTMAADAAMLQLTQAMSSGVLRGEELNSILEQTPTIAQAIAKHMGVSTGVMREMASEGAITAETVKNALFEAMEETNAKFEQMPMTWAQVWTSFQNTALFALRPVFSGINWLANNIRIVGPLVLGLGAAFVVFQVAAHWTKIAAIATGAYKFALDLLKFGYAVLTKQTYVATAATAKFMGTLLASPITWVVMGVMLLVGALYAGVAAFNKLTGASISATGIIVGALYTMGAQILNRTIIPIQRSFAAFANFIGNVFHDPVTAVKVLFYDMAITVIGYIQSLAGGIEDLINAIPGVQVNLTSGIDSLYQRMQSNRQAAISTGSYHEYVTAWEYKDLGEAFSSGYSRGSNLFSGSPFVPGTYDTPTFDQVSGIADSVSGIQKSVDMMDEDLQSLVDIAARRYVNNINLTSRAPVINVTGQNTGNTAADRMNLANTLRDILVQQVAAGSVQTTAKTF